MGGVALDLTGAGAIAGVPLNIASALVMAQGATSTMSGFRTFAHTMAMNGNNDYEDYHDPKWGKQGSQRSGGGGGRGPKGKKPDIQQIEAAAKQLKMSETERREFGDFVEIEKAAGRRGIKNDRGDFTFAELVKKGQEFLEDKQK